MNKTARRSLAVAVAGTALLAAPATALAQVPAASTDQFLPQQAVQPVNQLPVEYALPAPSQATAQDPWATVQDPSATAPVQLDRDQVAADVTRTIAEFFDVRQSLVKESVTAEDLGATRAQLALLQELFSNRYGIDAKNPAWDQVRTVSDMIDLIVAHQAAQAALPEPAPAPAAAPGPAVQPTSEQLAYPLVQPGVNSSL